MSKAPSIIFVLALFGCGHGVAGAFSGAEKGLKAIDIVGDNLSERWEAGVDARIAECKAEDLETSIEREKCMGKYGKGERFEDDAERLAEIYDEMTRLLSEGRRIGERLETLVGDEE